MLGSYLCFRAALMSELSSKSQYGLPQPFMAFPFSPKVPILQVMLQILYFLVRLNVPIFPLAHLLQVTTACVLHLVKMNYGFHSFLCS